VRSQRERVLQWCDQPGATGGISLPHQEAGTGRCAGALGWLLLPAFLGRRGTRAGERRRPHLASLAACHPRHLSASTRAARSSSSARAARPFPLLSTCSLTCAGSYWLAGCDGERFEESDAHGAPHSFTLPHAGCLAIDLPDRHARVLLRGAVLPVGSQVRIEQQLSLCR